MAGCAGPQAGVGNADYSKNRPEFAMSGLSLHVNTIY